MPKINLCITCGVRQKRLFIRFQYKLESGKYTNKWKSIGWICPCCRIVEQNHVFKIPELYDGLDL